VKGLPAKRCTSLIERNFVACILNVFSKKIMNIYVLGNHSCVSLLVKCCIVHTAVGCSLSPHVHFILFVYRCEVCDRIQLRTWILSYCIFQRGMMLFSHEVNQGPPTFLWQRATPVILYCWFTGHTRKNMNWRSLPTGLCPYDGDPCRKRKSTLNNSLGTLQLSCSFCCVITCAVRMCLGVARDSQKFPLVPLSP
jgi:hypothetical protein